LQSNDPQEGFTYAKQVIDGEILVCEDVKLACERFVRMYRESLTDDCPWVFNATNVEHMLWFANICRHVKGPQVGQPFILAPWQVFFICATFGFVWKDSGLRVVTDVILFICRKAGKSFTTSLICNYLLLWPNGYEGPREGACEIYVTATDSQQANIVFEAAQGLIDAMPKELASQYKLYKNTLHKVNDRLSVFRTLSRDSKKNAVGKGANVSITDEAAMVSREAILAVDNGMIHRLAPLRISISTAHHDRNSLFYERLNYCQSLLRGQTEDNPRWFALMYSVPENMAWDDPKSWYAANPMLGVNVPESVYANLCVQAKEMFSIRGEFMVRNLNYWLSAQDAWIDVDEWNACPHTPPPGTPDCTIIGIDLSLTRDLNAVAMISRYQMPDGEHYWLQIHSFLPEDAIKTVPAHVLPILERAIHDGVLTLTEGNVSDYSAIYAHIEKLLDTNNVDALLYDPWNAAALILKINENLSVVAEPCRQNITTLTNATKEFDKLVAEKRLHFPDIPLYAWCLSKCTLYTDPNNNIKVRKNDEHDKIDPIIASIIALKGCLDRPVYSSQIIFEI
jgi:phage terminase large subunit-like protein